MSSSRSEPALKGDEGQTISQGEIPRLPGTSSSERSITEVVDSREVCKFKAFKLKSPMHSQIHSFKYRPRIPYSVGEVNTIVRLQPTVKDSTMLINPTSFGNKLLGMVVMILRIKPH
jgi:hypothetical protein